MFSSVVISVVSSLGAKTCIMKEEHNEEVDESPVYKASSKEKLRISVKAINGTLN